jgi:RNA-directed DNA polymerase
MTEGQSTTASTDPSTELLGSAVTRDELAELLGVPSRKLRYWLYGAKPKKRYRSFDIKKRGGGVRKIRAPALPMKRLQKRIAELLERQYAPRSSVFGYVKGRNIRQNAERHLGRRWVLRVDLKDFFPSINFGRVRGLLLNKPFAMTKEAATAVAKLCCDGNELPQGSPASPIISNIICRGLDHALSKLAREHRCTYSRYCDDIVFSTNRSTFPGGLALRAPNGKVFVGAALSTVLQEAGFEVNPDKVQLRHNSQRQMVTGLIVNDNNKVNVPRDFVRELRMMLHVWRKLGHGGATAWYQDKKNRPSEKEGTPFKLIVRGKVQYLGSIKGWDHPLYVRLAARLTKLDSGFKPTKAPAKPPRLPTLRVFVEGHTDKDHIELALQALQADGRFRDLQLEIDGRDRGSPELLALCQTLSQVLQSLPTVCVFDADERGVIPKVSNGEDFKDWGNNVYSMVLPLPAHRTGEERWCIEHLYQDVDLQAADGEGRRLFLASEFHVPSGVHKTLKDTFNRDRSNSLVIDAVFHISNKKLGLSKHAFAQLVRARGNADFSGFVPLFEGIAKLRLAAAAKAG